MSNPIKILSLLVFMAPVACLAQFSISGRVLNQADIKPVVSASVFLSNATIGSITAPDGHFTLENVKQGKYRLIVSIVGFETYDQTILVNNSDIRLPDITIIPKTIGLKDVTIKANRNSDKYFNEFYDRFITAFLGPPEALNNCKILNPKVLDFDFDAETNMLTVSSQFFLQIENDALGYKINYLLTNFRLNVYTNEVHYEGPVLFTEMTGTPGQERSWQQNRKEVYEGSTMHFLRSALGDRLEEEGFRAYQLAVYANPERPPDSVTAAKIKRFSNPKYRNPPYQHLAGSLKPAPQTEPFVDSLHFYERKVKLPKILQALMHFPLNKGDIVSSTGQPGIFALGCDTDKLLIMYDKNHHFTEIKRLTDLNNLNYVLHKFKNKELTLLNFTTEYAFFDVNGWLTDPNSLVLNGAWSMDRIARLLPVNYEATENKRVIADSRVQDIENKLDIFTASNPDEKIHLHLDRSWYGLGDTIWFKAYAVSGEYHRPSTVSGVLYTELINQKDSVVKRLNLQLDSGIAQGDFILPYNYKNGAYRIRAYTNWMLNDSAYIYDRKIIVGGLPSPPNSSFTNTKQAISNAQGPSPGNPDVQFFPEGGDLVNGLRCKVAMKAINTKGVPVGVQGIIVDQDGNEVASFGTQHAGMGQFPLTPQPGMQYKAKILCADGSDFTVNLPKAKEAGFTLTINNATDSVYVKVAANDLFYKDNRNSAFYLIAQSAGKVYYTGSDKLVNPIFTTAIEKSRFPSGIVQFTLFSQAGEPFNERIVFVENNDRLKLAITTKKQSYTPMEKVEIGLEAKNEVDKAVAGSFSVAVTDETKVPVDDATEQTIFTDLLLTSELKGDIETPNYYFTSQDDKTRSDLDLLMLTQGYRKFEWKSILSGSSPEPLYQPEKALSLSGTIKTPSKKPIANGKVQLTSVGERFVADTLSDINGNFNFTNLYLSDTGKVIINARKANGNNNVNITIKRPVYPSVNKTDTSNYLSPDMPAPLLAALKQTYITGQQQYLKNVIQLKEVKIRSRRNEVFNPVYSENMQFSSNLNGPGNANQVLLSNVIMRGGGGKLSEILPGKIDFVTFQGGMAYSWRNQHSLSSRGEMAIFIEGAQVSPNMLDQINPDDVYSIEVLRSGGYLSIYGSNASHGALIITMKHGVDPVDPSTILVDGLITYKFNGFYKARTFYSPKYTSAAAPAADDRKTIYWNPNANTGADGKSAFEYFNAGSKGIYRVVVEGIDSDGNLGRQVFRYSVE